MRYKPRAVDPFEISSNGAGDVAGADDDLVNTYDCMLRVEAADLSDGDPQLPATDD